MGYRTDPLTGGTTTGGGVRLLRRATISSLMLVLALGAGGTRAAEDEPSATGAFGPAGSLAEARSFHTATLLPDGRLLVVGGAASFYPDTISLASVEILDPATLSFGLTGSLAEARFAHTATLLDDGRVLVVGGADPSGSDLNTHISAEIWDPATETFSSTGSLSEGRYGHTATLLSDGRVLVVGGVVVGGSGGGVTVGLRASAEVWDPSTRTFSPTGSLPEARVSHTATLVSDGRVFVVGGSSDGLPPLESALLWDPATGVFGPAGRLESGRQGHTATSLPDGSVLILGGEGESGQLASAESWDPATEVISSAESLAEARSEHTATVMSDGTILIVGGLKNDTGVYFASAERYDPETQRSTPVGSLRQPRPGYTATLLDDGSVLIVGGEGIDEQPLASAEVWEPGEG